MRLMSLSAVYWTDAASPAFGTLRAAPRGIVRVNPVPQFSCCPDGGGCAPPPVGPSDENCPTRLYLCDHEQTMSAKVLPLRETSRVLTRTRRGDACPGSHDHPCIFCSPTRRSAMSKAAALVSRTSTCSNTLGVPGVSPTRETWSPPMRPRLATAARLSARCPRGPGLDLGPGLAGGPASRAVQVSGCERGLAPLTTGSHGAPRVERGDGLRPRWRRNAAPSGRVLLPAVGDQQVHVRLPWHPPWHRPGAARGDTDIERPSSPVWRR